MTESTSGEFLSKKWNQKDWTPEVDAERHYSKQLKHVRNKREREALVEKPSKIIIQLKSSEGEAVGPQLEVPYDVSSEQLAVLLNNILNNEETLPYTFFIQAADKPIQEEITASLGESFERLEGQSTETALTVVYQPQALFRVRPVTRCTTSLEGHSEAVLTTVFSPDGRQLASGSGDATVRFWDLDTQTPRHTLSGFKHWVLALAFSPDGKRFAAASKNSEVRVWDAQTFKPVGKPMKGHSKWITALAWEPYHRNPECRRLASAGKDGVVKVWDVVNGTVLVSLSGHTMSVTCLRWGGNGYLYTASQDRTVRVWDVDRRTVVRTLTGHAHWVNTMALSTDYVLRTGPFDHMCRAVADKTEGLERAQARYDDMTKDGEGERLVTGSDDFTMFMWDPSRSEPIARMTGHQGIVNHVVFSPDGSLIASASFDKTVRVWDGRTGKLVAVLRGHVGPVYQVCWSGDSRLVASCSKDSTVKVWDVHRKQLKSDLPGHWDEVFAVDWSPDGQSVASGSKDRTVKIWKH